MSVTDNTIKAHHKNLSENEKTTSTMFLSNRESIEYYIKRYKALYSKDGTIKLFSYSKIIYKNGSILKLETIH